LGRSTGVTHRKFGRMRRFRQRAERGTTRAGWHRFRSAAVRPARPRQRPGRLCLQEQGCDRSRRPVGFRWRSTRPTKVATRAPVPGAPEPARTPSVFSRGCRRMAAAGWDDVGQTVARSGAQAFIPG
jgi:hypothetical protein